MVEIAPSPITTPEDALMCGLAGTLCATSGLENEPLHRLVDRMGAALRHRGPDDSGVWVDATDGIALAHRRLSILDLSPLGHQPMVSADGRYVLSYNGEIYDFAKLREQLLACGHGFRGHSDSEVLLAAFSEWGVVSTLGRCNGMFALALWDRHEKCLWLARDRVGKKPLYYGWAGGALVFASELKALWQHPDFDNGVDRDALTLLLRLGYIPAPHCIHEQTFKMQPGTVLRMDARTVAAGAAAHQPLSAQQSFWNARESMLESLRQPFTASTSDAEEQLDRLLQDAVALRTVADVPVGVFLSGGTDSSLVASIMQRQSDTPIHSFSIGFRDSSHDEAPLAREVASFLGTDHTELYVSGSDALELVPKLPDMFDEPFADASQLPTALLTRLARSKVTVALSGDGGDELFFGYSRYQRALRNWKLLKRIPSPLRALVAQQPSEFSRTGAWAAVRADAAARGIGDIYRQRISRWRAPAALVIGAQEPQTLYSAADPLSGASEPGDAMMLADFAVYLPDDLLCKVDRTSMAVGLEARAPLLDWRVARFAWSLPMRMKLNGGVSKYLLKRVLGRYLPDTMVHRGKRGFGAPVGDWLRGDLHAWADALLDPRHLQQQGIFDPRMLRSIWSEFDAGQRKWHTHLWGVLMFQAWHSHWRQVRAATARR